MQQKRKQIRPNRSINFKRNKANKKNQLWFIVLNVEAMIAAESALMITDATLAKMYLT